jgi:hypothetical protein
MWSVKPDSAEQKGGGGMDLGARQDVNGACISTWETQSYTAVKQCTFSYRNLNWLFKTLFRKQTNSALGIEADAGEILLFRIPKPMQLLLCTFIKTKHKRHSQVAIQNIVA